MNFTSTNKITVILILTSILTFTFQLHAIAKDTEEYVKEEMFRVYFGDSPRQIKEIKNDDRYVPVQFTYDDAENFYILDAGNNKVKIYDIKGNLIKFISLTSPYSEFNKLCVADNKLYHLFNETTESNDYWLHLSIIDLSTGNTLKQKAIACNIDYAYFIKDINNKVYVYFFHDIPDEGGWYEINNLQITHLWQPKIIEPCHKLFRIELNKTSLRVLTLDSEDICEFDKLDDNYIFIGIDKHGKIYSCERTKGQHIKIYGQKDTINIKGYPSFGNPPYIDSEGNIYQLDLVPNPAKNNCENCPPIEPGTDYSYVGSFGIRVIKWLKATNTKKKSIILDDRYIHNPSNIIHIDNDLQIFDNTGRVVKRIIVGGHNRIMVEKDIYTHVLRNMDLTPDEDRFWWDYHRIGRPKTIFQKQMIPPKVVFIDSNRKVLNEIIVSHYYSVVEHGTYLSYINYDGDCHNQYNNKSFPTKTVEYPEYGKHESYEMVKSYPYFAGNNKYVAIVDNKTYRRTDANKLSKKDYEKPPPPSNITLKKAVITYYNEIGNSFYSKKYDANYIDSTIVSTNGKTFAYIINNTLHAINNDGKEVLQYEEKRTIYVPSRESNRACTMKEIETISPNGQYIKITGEEPFTGKNYHSDYTLFIDVINQALWELPQGTLAPFESGHKYRIDDDGTLYSYICQNGCTTEVLKDTYDFKKQLIPIGE